MNTHGRWWLCGLLLLAIVGCATTGALSIGNERAIILADLKNHYLEWVAKGLVAKDAIGIIRDFEKNSMPPNQPTAPDPYNLFGLFRQLRNHHHLLWLDEIDPGEEPWLYHAYQDFLDTEPH